MICVRDKTDSDDDNDDDNNSNLIQLCAVIDLNYNTLTWCSYLCLSFNRALQMNNTGMWIILVHLLNAVQLWRSREICMLEGSNIPVRSAKYHSH
jgi:hypothetical protein